MLQEYVRNVSVVSILCCNKCFHVASRKCFYLDVALFHIHVAGVCSKCFICFRCMLPKKVFSCCKCVVFQRYVQRVMGHGRTPGEGRGEPEVSGWGTRCAWGPADRARSSSSRLPGPARVEREEGSGERSGRCGAGRGERGTGYACEAGRGV
jgi:hypothetical protein